MAEGEGHLDPGHCKEQMQLVTTHRALDVDDKTMMGLSRCSILYLK